MSSKRRNEGDDRRRRISLRGSARLMRLAPPLSGLGFLVVDEGDEETDLALVETDDPTELEPFAGAPILVVAPSALSAERVRSLHLAGAAQVLDPDAPLFDLLLAIVASTFKSMAEQRRYWRAHGGVAATAEVEGGRTVAIRIVGFAATSLFLRLDPGLPTGARVDIQLNLFGAPMHLPGRVAYVHRDMVAVELFGGELPLSPRLEPEAKEARSPRPPTRTPSTDRAHA